MKFLIRETFFKDIKKEKINYIEKNLLYFYEEILKNINNIREIPKGFWIKKLKGIENRFEFRINNGDRVFFSLDKRKDEEEKITFILYSSHDRGVKKGKNAEINNVEEFSINKNEFIEENEEIPQEVYLDYSQVISYEVTEDGEFSKVGSDKNIYYYYYLNDEQYEALKEPTPLLVAGSAGSGKSTITIRKILNLEEYQEFYGIKKIGYFTGNALLKDTIKEQYQIFRKKDLPKITDFYTPREYYKKTLGIDTRKIVRLKKFKEFISFSFPNRKKLGVEDFNIYFEIMGILKGLMSKGSTDNWDKDLTSKLMSLENYLNLNKNYSLLDDESKKAIYKIAEKYEEWKDENNLYDMNDLVVRAIKNQPQYDFIIVDEIQDFTEVEIYFMLSLLKDKRNILLAGDIHQMINFNSFSFERLRNYYFKNNLQNTEIVLSKNYRNSKSIVELANFLTELRKEYIGNLGVKDYKENFIVDRGSITVIPPDYELLKKVQTDVKFVIIVSSKEEKYKLDKFSDIHMRVFSVDEVKGLEYDNVVCLNLATTNLFAWEKIFNKDVKRDQRYRKYFNLFYVGITRSRKNLIIMEEKISGNKLLEKIKDFITISDNNDKEKINRKINKEIHHSNKEEWLQEGIRLYNVENYEEAQKAFEMAGYPTWILEKNIEEDIENGDYKLALEKINKNNLDKKKKHYENLIVDTLLKKEEYIKTLIYIVEILDTLYKYNEVKRIFTEKLEEGVFSKKELDRAIAIFSKKQENNILGDIYSKQNNYLLAINFYKKASNFIGISKMRKKILEENFKNIENSSEKIDIVENLLGKKDINSFDKNKLTPIFNSLKYQNIDILDMLIYLGAKYNGKVQGKYDILTYISKENYPKSIELYKYFLDKGYEYIFDSKVETPMEFSLKNKNRELTEFILESKIIKDDYSGLDTNPIDLCAELYEIKYFKIFMKKLDLEKISDKIVERLFQFIINLTPTTNIQIRKKELMKKIYIRIVATKYPDLKEKLKKILKEKEEAEKNLDKK
ncbi:UvrD-helicase domain-containing protein [Fusobacterium perfoetens]|uniref:UvrD-helicase domain-containing protein n=1 Tax=Fusobacterium perfoetens TaxID=852 RepID=UPI0004871524|nr:UvrD-helicase domain-containing protein [Fusobacterium perfoetens]